MRKIWKYKITSDTTEIDMPLNSVVISVQVQKGELFIWAEVDAKNAFERRTFKAYGTGREIPCYSQLEYLGTVQRHDYVIHLYEMLSKP